MFHCLWPSNFKMQIFLGFFCLFQEELHVLLCLHSISVLFPPSFASNMAPFPQGKSTVLYSWLLWPLEHPPFIVVHIHHKPGPSASCTSCLWLQTALQGQVTARKNMDHSLKVEQFLSCQGTWFSLDTNDVVRSQSSSKCPLKQPHNRLCLTQSA